MKGRLAQRPIVPGRHSGPRGWPAHRAPLDALLHHADGQLPSRFILTDAAINIAPSLEDKADIVRNAIDLAPSSVCPNPKVAILAAVETVNPRMRSTLDAATLCKMADRGRIRRQPDRAGRWPSTTRSRPRPRKSRIRSAVAGQADVLVVPDLESGNMLAQAA